MTSLLLQNGKQESALPLSFTIFRSSKEEQRESTELKLCLHLIIFYTRKSHQKVMCGDLDFPDFGFYVAMALLFFLMFYLNPFMLLHYDDALSLKKGEPVLAQVLVSESVSGRKKMVPEHA